MTEIWFNICLLTIPPWTSYNTVTPIPYIVTMTGAVIILSKKLHFTALRLCLHCKETPQKCYIGYKVSFVTENMKHTTENFISGEIFIKL